MDIVLPSKIPKTKENIDKKFVKTICRMIYYIGLGDCWYEPMETPLIPRHFYVFITAFTHLYCSITIFCELLAFTRDDLNAREYNDLVIFCIGHITAYPKFFILMSQTNKIKLFYKKLIEDMRLPQSSLLDGKSIRTSKVYIFVLTFTMQLCLASSTINAFLLHYKEGAPIRTLITVWPTYSDSGILVDIVRVFIQLLWWYLVTIMCMVDSLCLTALVFLGYKFRLLQMFFENLKSDFLKNIEIKSRDAAEEEYTSSVLAGIKFHNKLLWCARSLQKNIGLLYSIQVVQSILLLAVSLIKMVRNQRSLSLLLESMALLLCMATITGCYMMSCGDITNEAALVPLSVYKSGWELIRSRKQIKPLIVLAIQNSARPVTMTAFGVYGLSYNNFIHVIRISYSFFAVMY